MSLKTRYNTLKIYEYKEGNSDVFPPVAKEYKQRETFKGLIQNAQPSNSYNNGKDTAFVSAILFCEPNQVFKSTDIIENINGARYKIANSDLQVNGITGIVGHHSEYSLIYVQEGL